MELKLEVGKAYKARDGEKIAIEKLEFGAFYGRGQSTGGWYYEPNGKLCGIKGIEDSDIVAEWTDEQQSPEIDPTPEIEPAEKEFSFKPYPVDVGGTIKLETNAPIGLQLEIGNSYKTRDGKKVTITHNDGDEDWPFNGDNGESYQTNGKSYSDDTDFEEDLIAEWVEPAEDKVAFTLKPETIKSIRDLKGAAVSKVFDAVVMGIIFIGCVVCVSDFIGTMVEKLEISKWWGFLIFLPSYWLLRRVALWLLK